MAEIEGSASNVVGLPLTTVVELLGRQGVAVAGGGTSPVSTLALRLLMTTWSAYDWHSPWSSANARPNPP